jgi:hypothetical protein
MSEKLLPCPRCQWDGDVMIVEATIYRNEETIYIPKCKNSECLDSRINLAFSSVDKAIAVWNQRPRCQDCKHWDQYADFNLDTMKTEGLMNLGGCYKHSPVKTTEIGIQTEKDFYCAKFERREDMQKC